MKSEYNTRSRLCGEFPFNIRYLGIEVIEHIAVTYMFNYLNSQISDIEVIEVIEHIAVTYITAKWNKFNLFIISDFLLLILMQIYF